MYVWWPVSDSDSLRPIHTTLLLKRSVYTSFLPIQKKCGVNSAKAVTYGPPYVRLLHVHNSMLRDAYRAGTNHRTAS